MWIIRGKGNDPSQKEHSAFLQEDGDKKQKRQCKQ